MQPVPVEETGLCRFSSAKIPNGRRMQNRVTVRTLEASRQMLARISQTEVNAHAT
jgi:hypothetical protein